jgi:DNA repair exonuclease SbcCD nuclease subunit
MLNLVVGDVHAVPEELEDCRALIGLVCETVKRHDVDLVTFTGDQHNNHDTMSTRVMAFWKESFDRIRAAGREPNVPWKSYKDWGLQIAALVGNHDQANPRDRFPHAMLAYTNQVHVVDKPGLIAPNVVAMPFYHDPVEFLAAAEKLKEENPEAETLFCHQTFVGADGSFYAKDECSALAVPFRTVLSGHIHTPQVVDKKVIYVGAPRWRAKDDAGKNRYIYVIEHGSGPRPKVIEKVATDTVCRRIWLFEDRPGAPAPIDTVPNRQLAQIRVEVFGPAAHVKLRCEELRAAGCRARPVPDRTKTSTVSEAEGVDVAFNRYLGAFVPPFGTNLDVLRGMLERRLAK